MDESVQSEYNERASHYDREWSEYIQSTVKETKARLPPIDPADCVLDVACGTGVLALQLLAAHQPLSIAGVDISSEMLKVFANKAERELGKANVFLYQEKSVVDSALLTRQGSKVVLVETTAESLPFEACSFDGIVSTNAFHYFPDAEASLLEMKRVLKPGGWLVLTDWCDDFLFCKLCKFWLQLRRKPFAQFYGTETCSSMVRSAGFNVQRADQYRVSTIWGMMTIVARKSVDC